MRIGVAADHAGKELKELVVEMLKLSDHEVFDFGVARDSKTSVDYPDYAASVARDVSNGKLDCAVAICGTGIGMAITANKFPGVRASVVWDEFSTRMAKAHNNINVLCLGARTTNHMRATEFVKLWLDTPFEGSRHNIRLGKINELEQKLRHESPKK